MRPRYGRGHAAGARRRGFLAALHFDGSIESRLAAIGIAGGLLFLTLTTTLFVVQRVFVSAQHQLVGTALPVAQTLRRLEAKLASAFERQAQVVASHSLEQLSEVRDRAAIDTSLKETETILGQRQSTAEISKTVGGLYEHGRAFMDADEGLFRSMERRHRLRVTFEAQLADVDANLAQLIQSTRALSGVLHLEHVIGLRRLAREMKKGAPSAALVRQEVLGGVQGRMVDVADLVQGVIGVGRLASKTGLAVTDDALNSISANEWAPTHSLIESLLAGLARWATPGSDVARRIASLRQQFEAVSPRISDEARQDSLIWLRRNILSEIEVARQMLRESARTMQMLSLDLAALDRSSARQTDLAVASAAAAVRWSRLGSLVVSLIGLIGCVVAGLRIRNSVQSLAATNEELADLRDNLERRVARRTAQLSASREQYRLLVESTKTLPFELDAATGDFLYIGPQVEDMFGVTSATCVAPGFLDVHLHPGDRARTMAALARALDERTPSLDMEVRIRKTDSGYAWLRMLAAGGDAAAVEGPGEALDPSALMLTGMHRLAGKGAGRVEAAASGRTWRGIFIDVSQTHEMEAQLRQAQKLESVGRLASGVAHEINTPVQFVNDSVHFIKEAFRDLAAVLESHRALRDAVVKGTATVEMAQAVLRAEDAADVAYVMESAPGAIDRSLEGLRRITSIVRSMKEFAHPDQKEMSPTDLNQCLSSTLTIAHNEYKYVADVELGLTPLPAVTCHAGEMNQVFLNIIVNAAHAIEDVVKGTQSRGRIVVTSRRDGDHVEVSIADTGGGIPGHIREHIFDPFFTTKEVGKGTGQGLAIARSIVVDKHGGELRVESESGAGTTFFIRLPIAGKVRSAVDGIGA